MPHGGNERFARLAAVTLVGLCACSREEAPAGPAEPARPRVAAIEESNPASELLTTLRSRYVVDAPQGAQAALPPGRATRFEIEAERIRAVFDEQAERDVDARVLLPRRAVDPTRIQDVRSGMALEFRLDGARQSRAEVADGIVTYRGGGPHGADLLHRVSPRGTEDFLVVAEGTSRVTYSVELGNHVAGLRLVSNTLEFLDEGGSPRLRVARPYLVDDNQQRHEASLQLLDCDADRSPASPWGRAVTPAGANECRVQVSWKPADVAYPALLDPAWTSTGSMIAPRFEHSADLLTNGLVLVAGGNAGFTLDVCELFNPDDETWAATDPLDNPRSNHASALLSSAPLAGFVLVAGGSPAGVTSELYDPSMGTWRETGDLQNNVSNPIELSLNDGRVATLNGQEFQFYSPSSETWVVGTAPLPEYRSETTATVLSNGNVLIVGGFISGLGTTSVLLFDPVMQTYSDGPALPARRYRHAATSLPDGRVMISGGTGNLDASTTALIYDPSNPGWTSGGTLHGDYSSTHFLIPYGADGAMTLQYEAGIWSSGTNTWAPIGYSFTGSGQTVTVLQSGRPLIVSSGGGRIFELEGQGGDCTYDAECATGFCTDGVCCASRCDGHCQTCLAAYQTSGTDGICGFAAANRDPRNECEFQDYATCGTTGQCNGAGACALHVNQFCSSRFCESESASQAEGQCNGSGTCAAGATQPCGEGYRCNDDDTGTNPANFCNTWCDEQDGIFDNPSCLDGYLCVGGSCLQPLARGAWCDTTDDYCASGHCIDGYCCNTECDGVCETCSGWATSGAVGECSPVSEFQDPADECSPQDASTCGRLDWCDGAGACALHEAGTVCVAGACIDSDTEDTASTCDGAGTCVDNGNLDCAGGTTCVAGECRTSCFADTDCVTSRFCDLDGIIAYQSCVASYDDGDSCSRDRQCASGHCVEGICCDEPCDGTCESCFASDQDAGTDGTCGPIAIGTDPYSECDAQQVSTCGFTGDCDGAGACATYAADTVCVNASCVNASMEVSADTCDGSGTCVDNGTASCSPGYLCGAGCRTSCGQDAECAAGYFCDTDVGATQNTCVASRSTGSPCGRSRQCSTSSCVDGFCCDSPCSGPCESCASTFKGSGSDGECGPIAAGTDPNDDCAQEPVSTCGRDGECNGQGACRLHQDGTVCAASVCSSLTSITAPMTCDGSGACEDNGVDDCDGGYTCSFGMCQSSCTEDGNCVDDHFCSGSECVDDLEVGSACTRHAQCESGYCVDEVCCESACDGECEACSEALKDDGDDGQCGPASEGTDPHDDCQSATDCGNDGQCDGSGACRLKEEGTRCGASVCVTEISQSLPATCDGLGTCLGNGEAECDEGYLCLAGACRGDCTLNEHCTASHFCDLSTNACAPRQELGAACSEARQCASNLCVDEVCCDGPCDETCFACSAATKGGGSDGTCEPVLAGQDPIDECVIDRDSVSTCVTDPFCDGRGACSCSSAECSADGRMRVTSDGEHDCSPYRCSDGECVDECTSSSECVETHRCSSEGRCVARRSGTTHATSAGCSLSQAQHHAWSRATWLGIFAWIAGRRRRRSAAVRTSTQPPRWG